MTLKCEDKDDEHRIHGECGCSHCRIERIENTVEEIARHLGLRKW